MANIRVTIEGSAGSFTAKVDDPKKSAERAELVKWKVDRPEPADFPADGVIFIQFPGEDPLIDGTAGRHNGRRTSNDHFVRDRVGFVDEKSYTYKIFYHDSLGDHLLLDPELIVDGGPDTTPPGEHRGGGKKGGGKKKAAKKKAKSKKTAKKKAKKTKKAKTAKRSTKRKAKKR